ncbi:pdf receptor-like protein-related [Holotrichia oblita]|uniref:Pdf receptor-like protein-related n=1 Tax=Holotrichia oblita TaxID=644536 RepID=A0ACB9T4Y9_HOLOL|nr:pdf receptor-like protein-related [Holotrichia oblita]
MFSSAGLYLYILVVKTLTRENFKLRVYACIGWGKELYGVPSVIIVVWAIVKSFMSLDASQDDTSSAILFRHCPWLKAHLVDWIHQVPVIIVLLLNLFFLASIMWVLITKLRSANTVETQQYRKAAKALLVLMPLLGVTYMLMITTPPGEAYIMTMFYYGRAVLLSTQSKVRNSFVHVHIMYSIDLTCVCIRLYSQPGYKRESCTSDVTTTTMVTVNGGHGPHPRSPFLQPPKPNYGGNV